MCLITMLLLSVLLENLCLHKVFNLHFFMFFNEHCVFIFYPICIFYKQICLL